MGRWQPVDHRRRGRRRLSSWIWFLLGSFSVAGLVLFMVQHYHHQQDPSQLLFVCLSLLVSWIWLLCAWSSLMKNCGSCCAFWIHWNCNLMKLGFLIRSVYDYDGISEVSELKYLQFDDFKLPIEYWMSEPLFSKSSESFCSWITTCGLKILWLL